MAFGGGGHTNAAGFTLEATTEKRDVVVQQVVAAVEAALGRGNGKSRSKGGPS